MSMSLIVLALVSGSLFGFFLHRGGVARSCVILDQLLLRNFTVMKIMLTAIFVASLCIYGFDALGFLPKFRLSPTPVFYSAIGGGVFALGMVFSGYCPGTMVAALGAGVKEMIPGLFGMFFGGFLYNRFWFMIFPNGAERDSLYQETLPSYFALSPFMFSLLFGLIVLLFIYLDRRGVSSGRLSVSNRRP